MARQVGKSSNAEERCKLIASVASAIGRNNEMLRLLYVSLAPRVGQYAKDHGISEPNVSVIFKDFEKKEWISREGRKLKAATITPRGRDLLNRWAEEVAHDIERAVKDPGAMYEDGVRGAGNARRMIGKALRGEQVTLVEAVKLEDLGYGKRLSGRKIEITEKGVSFFRNGRRGPLPGKGNRTTVVVMPSKE